ISYFHRHHWCLRGSSVASRYPFIGHHPNEENDDQSLSISSPASTKHLKPLC
ncbi:Uncharacterized protein DAT39_020308, partial [Clarias magur]